MEKQNDTQAQGTGSDLSAQEAIDGLENITRHPGYRRLHARGEVYQGVFKASGLVSHLTTARYLHDDQTPILVRLSNGSGDPATTDTMPGIRGMAVRFLIDGKPDTDLVAVNTKVFPVHDIVGFVELNAMITQISSGQLSPQQIQARLGDFMQRYPESIPVFQGLDANHIPASAATTQYYGANAFFLVDRNGVRHPYRYRLVPDLGEVYLTAKEVAQRDPHFWLPEMNERVAAGPIGFTLVFQLGNPDDVTNNPTIAWPEERPLIVAGHLEITGQAPNAAELEREIFDPTHISAGVELSDDPILLFRHQAYTVSAERRLQGK